MANDEPAISIALIIFLASGLDLGHVDDDEVIVVMTSGHSYLVEM